MDGVALDLVAEDTDLGDDAARPSVPVGSLDRLPTPDAWDGLASSAPEPNPFHER